MWTQGKRGIRPGPDGRYALSEPEDGAWVLLPVGEVPEPWRGRARQVALIPLLPEELAAVLSGRAASPALDERDERIARLLTTGASLAEIGRAVGLSPRGVQHRLAALRRRFGVHSTAELAAYLARHGLGGGTNTQ